MSPPNDIGEQLDTLEVDFYCGGISEKVQVRTFVEPLELGTRDRCGNPINFSVGGFIKRSFLATPTPNPATGASATITLGLSENGDVTLALYNLEGNVVRRLLDHDQIPGGITQIQARVDDLPIGVYYLRMVTASGGVQTEKLVVGR